MASTTRYLKSLGKWLLYAIARLAIFAGLAAPLVAHAEGAAILSARIEANDEGYQLAADIELQLSSTLQEAVRKGVPLYFVAEFELTRDRWYWLDQKVITTRRERRLSYAPLTEHYRVTTSGITQTITTFEDVRKLLSRIRAWTVAEKNQLKAGEKYQAALRFRLDTSQLPKPFQLNVITTKDWNVSSDWIRWSYTP